MTERSAKGVKGFLLYSPFTKKHFFRVYDPEDKRKYVDYDVHAEEIEIEIIGKFVALYESETKNKLDFTSKVLGK